jgi:hypothetical protein
MFFQRVMMVFFSDSDFDEETLLQLEQASDFATKKGN